MRSAAIPGQSQATGVAEAPAGVAWPALPLAEWQDTRDTLHLWTQVVGKIRLGLMPPRNHWWQVPLYVTARGLTTSLMPYRNRSVEIEFDFHRHVLDIRTSDGETSQVSLEPRSAADFYAETMRRMGELGVEGKIFTRPIEVADAIPFEDDHEHVSYDPVYAHRFWQSLVNAQRVFVGFGSGFVGKTSPINFWWGGVDPAGGRFSRRLPPPPPRGVPHRPDLLARFAYTHAEAPFGYRAGGTGGGTSYAP